MRHEDALPRLAELVGLRSAAADDGALEAHVLECARCRARLDALRIMDARLRDLEEPPAPSASLERRVLAIPRSVGTTREGRRGGRVRGRGPAIAAAVVALLAVAALGLVITRDDSRSDSGFQAERVVQLGAPRGGAAAVQVELGDPSGGRLPVRLIATGLAHGRGRFYGLWLSGAQGAISAGSFRPDGGGRCVVMLQAPAGNWTSVAITDDDQPPSTTTTVASAPL